MTSDWNMIIDEKNSTCLVGGNVFKESGECIGSIDELLIDPYTGIVRSVLLKTRSKEILQIPWNGILFDKSSQAFRLTPFGESRYRQKCCKSQPYNS